MGHLLGLYLVGCIVYLTISVYGLIIMAQSANTLPWEWFANQIAGMLAITLLWPLGVIQTIYQVKLIQREEHEAIEAMHEKPEDAALAIEAEEHSINAHAKRLWVQLVKQGLDHGMPGNHAALQADAGVELFRRFSKTVDGHQQRSGHWQVFYLSSLDSDEAAQLVKQFARRFPARPCSGCGQIHD